MTKKRNIESNKKSNAKSKNSQESPRTFASELLFYLHAPIFIFWVVPFFIPISLWPNRVEVHFWYIIILTIVQYVTGIFYYKTIGRLQSICPVTIVMQRLRGYNWFDKETYTHSFVAELWGRWFGISSSKGQVNFLQHITFVVVLLQYFFGILVI